MDADFMLQTGMSVLNATLQLGKLEQKTKAVKYGSCLNVNDCCKITHT